MFELNVKAAMLQQADARKDNNMSAWNRANLLRLECNSSLLLTGGANTFAQTPNNIEIIKNTRAAI